MVVFDSSLQPHHPHPVHKRALWALPPEHILNPSVGPHPGLGTAISYLVACPGLLPGVLASILPPRPRGQFVIYLESEGIFKDVNQVTILSNLQNTPGAPCCNPDEALAPKVPAHLYDLISAPCTPPYLSSSHTSLVFTSSHSKSLPPLCLCTCFSCLKCSSVSEHHLLRGPLCDCDLNVSLLLSTPLLFLILLWLGHCWAAQKGTDTQIFSECLLRQWMASGPICG